ncbi:uncharacterized protein LOC131671664 [Phymastichus coffea]|uniref:uncharacterized protein LOC131671664 n=1 Tax=Phymastichus coffea TaxID=108790 RepID=UPI00273B41F3|nr:uncharacterized protein LOC131671664 [Phymastichus coffea]
MVFPHWIHSTTKYILIGVGLLCASECTWCLYKKFFQRKIQCRGGASKSIAEVLFFSEECERCRNHANTNKPCSLASCPLRNLNKVIEYLGTATTSVDVCVYFLTCNVIIKAIIDLRRRNILVRVITDDESTGNDISQVLIMRKAGIKVRCRRSESFYLMHHKFVIVDKKLLISGSANWTMQAFYGNSENILITNHNDIVVQYMKEFENLWLEFSGEVDANSSSNIEVNLSSMSQKEKQCTDGTSEPIAEVLFFSKKCASCRNHANSNIPCSLASCPLTNLNKVIGYIETATKTVDVCVYMLTCNAIVKAIIDLQRKNVFIRVISDNDSCGNDASQALNMQKSGIKVRCRKSTCLMHHKFVIVDKKLLISGSANWTMQAFYGNYENILLTNHSDIVVQYLAEFDKLWVKLGDEVNINFPNNITRRPFQNGN